MPRLAHHIVYSAYGFWLPNDPRGSWSTFVGSEGLYERFGSATKVSATRSLARRPHNHARCLAGKRALAFTPAVFAGRQAREVALAIKDVASAKGLAVFACAVMPDHVHLVLRTSRSTPAQILAACRSRASRRLHDAGLWPADRPIWGRGRWVVDLHSDSDVLARIHYVQQNPIKAGLPPQRWSFIQPFP
jgi:REP element-mobilizing transposase RayT